MRRPVAWVWCLLGVLALLALAAPGGARADGTVTLVSGELRFSSNSQDAENLVITRATNALNCDPRPVPCLQLANGPQQITDGVAGTACEQLVFNGGPFDTIVVCALTVAPRIRLTLNDGDDFVFVGANVPPTTMDGGTGEDNLSSDSGADTLLGGPGDDELSDDGSSGADLIDGGADDDAIALGGGADDVRGGTGVDTVRMDSGDDTVRLDDLANDGRPGEGKNVRADVEVVDGGGGSDNLFGNALANTLVGGSGNDIIDGGGGADVLEGGTGADELNGGAGVDRVVYPETADQAISLNDVRDDGAAGELDNVHADIEDVAAGPGNDVVVGSAAANVLDGGAGNDRLDGRGGVDRFVGGAGADALLARDGLAERVDCGADTDTVEADTIDLLVTCEGVSVSSILVPDADRDGSAKPADCDDGNAAIRPGSIDIPDNGIDEDCSGADAVNLDRDGDGSLRPADCDDANPAVHPGARDRPGNRIDEDCSRGDASFRPLRASISFAFSVFRTYTRLDRLRAVQLRGGERIRLRCKGGGCPFKAKRLKARKGGSRELTALVRGARFRPGARLEVLITRPRAIGRYRAIRFRDAKRPTVRKRCLQPGARKPSKCPR